MFICTIETSELQKFTANNTGHNIPDNVVALTICCDSDTNRIKYMSGDTDEGQCVDLIDDRMESSLLQVSYLAIQPLADMAKAKCVTHSAPGWISSNVYGTSMEDSK